MTKKILSFFGGFALFFLCPLSAQTTFDVYISDAGNFNNPPWQILKFDQNGDNGEVFIDKDDPNLAWPQDILFLEGENAVLITNLNSGNISKFNADTGEFIENFATGIGGPTRMEVGPDGLLYVLQWSNNTKVLRYQLDGTPEGEFTDTNTGTAIGLDWDAEGNLYVSSYNGGYVRKFDSEGVSQGDFISANLAGPTNIWFADNGDLFVVDYNGNTVDRFNSEGEFQGSFITGLPQGEGVDFLDSGNIIIGSGGTSSVRTYDSEGMLVGDFVAPGTLDLLTPNAVVFRGTTPSSTEEVFREMTFVTPSVGSHFRVENIDPSNTSAFFEIYDSSGTLVERVNFSEGQNWAAKNYVDGIYFFTIKLSDGAVARQKVVVKN